jgi:Tol biopolymer transport system component
MQIHPIRLHMLDLRSGQRTLITDGAEPYDLPTMSADGSVAAFASPGLMLAATSPAGTGPLTAPGIYVWERLTNTTTLVSVRSGGAPGPWAQPFVPEPNCFIPLADSVCIPFPPTPVKLGISASNPQISPDGRWVVFDSLQRLADDDIDESADVYVHDRW